MTAPPAFTEVNKLGRTETSPWEISPVAINAKNAVLFHRRRLLDSSGTAPFGTTLQKDVSVHRQRDGSNSAALPTLGHVKTTKTAINRAREEKTDSFLWAESFPINHTNRKHRERVEHNSAKYAIDSEEIQHPDFVLMQQTWAVQRVWVQGPRISLYDCLRFHPRRDLPISQKYCLYRRLWHFVFS